MRDNGAAIVATNPDPYCPTPDGGLPDCAAMLAATRGLHRRPRRGGRRQAKSAHGRRVLARLDVDPASVAVVGDRLSTDVAMGQQIGAAGILVLTGATSADDAAASEVRPDYVIDGIHQLIPQNQGRST